MSHDAAIINIYAQLGFSKVAESCKTSYPEIQFIRQPKQLENAWLLILIYGTSSSISIFGNGMLDILSKSAVCSSEILMHHCFTPVLAQQHIVLFVLLYISYAGYRRHESNSKVPSFYTVTNNAKERPDVWIDRPEK
jgi:hypothetical protein